MLVHLCSAQKILCVVSEFYVENWITDECYCVLKLKFGFWPTSTYPSVKMLNITQVLKSNFDRRQKLLIADTKHKGLVSFRGEGEIVSLIF